MVAGDINKEALLESFHKIKEDIIRLNSEVISLRAGLEEAKNENAGLKRQLSESFSDFEKKVEQAVSARTLKKPALSDMIIRKVNRSKKNIIKSRILELSAGKSMTVADIKEILVESEGLCSKATFYRYIERLKSRKMIEEISIDDRKIMARIAIIN